MDETTVADALVRAQEAGLTDIEQIRLEEEATSVIGVDEDEELRQLYLQAAQEGPSVTIGD